MKSGTKSLLFIGFLILGIFQLSATFAADRVDPPEWVRNASRAVSWVTQITKQGKPAHSTGFLIGSKWVLMAGHSFETEDDCKGIQFHFWDGDTSDVPSAYGCEKVHKYISNKDGTLDFAVVELNGFEKDRPDTYPGDRFGVVELGDSGDIKTNEDTTFWRVYYNNVGQGTKVVHSILYEPCEGKFEETNTATGDGKKKMRLLKLKPQANGIPCMGRPGHSGSAVFSEKGLVVGVLSGAVMEKKVDAKNKVFNNYFDVMKEIVVTPSENILYEFKKIKDLIKGEG